MLSWIEFWIWWWIMSTACHEMDALGWAFSCVFQRQKDGCCSWFQELPVVFEVSQSIQQDLSLVGHKLVFTCFCLKGMHTVWCAVESNQADHVKTGVTLSAVTAVEKSLLPGHVQAAAWQQMAECSGIGDFARLKSSYSCAAAMCLQTTFLHVHGCLNKMQEGTSSIEPNIMIYPESVCKWFRIVIFFWDM